MFKVNTLNWIYERLIKGAFNEQQDYIKIYNLSKWAIFCKMLPDFMILWEETLLGAFGCCYLKDTHMQLWAPAYSHSVGECMEGISQKSAAIKK